MTSHFVSVIANIGRSAQLAPRLSLPQWVHAHNGNGRVVNLFMDYETFGEHQWEDTGIFNFLRALPADP